MITMRPLLCLSILLTGCAGHEAMIWKQPQPNRERVSSYCEVQAGDKVCTSMPESEVREGCGICNGSRGIFERMATIHLTGELMATRFGTTPAARIASSWLCCSAA